MANIMNMVKLKNKTSRNGFDLSHKNLFTAKVGELLPVACIECIPGDSFDIDMAWFTRTQPVNTAAYTRMREYYDWYFVPTDLLWNKFGTFVTQMTDNNQKATGINGNVVLSDEHPYFTTDEVGNGIFNLTNKKNFFGYDRAHLSTKLLQYLNYGDYSSYIGVRPSVDLAYNVRLNPFPLLAYQKIYQDFFRDSQWEKAYAPAYNVDYISGAAGTLNIPLDDIDFDNECMLDLRYCNWNKDYFMGLLPNSQYGDIAQVDVDSIGDISLQLGSPSAFYNYLRLTPYRTDESVLYAKGSSNNASQAGYVYMAGGNGGDPTENVSQYLDVNALNTLRTSLGLTTASIEDIPRMFSVLALRQAEAKQKWAEITQSNQQDYKSQIEAHFGVNVSDAYSDRCKYIGGVAGNVDIAPVTNTNLVDNQEADIAGRGEGGARGSINFNTKVHGYIMCIYHCVPLLDYAIDGIQRQNLKTTVYDYAQPEFDATGMVSVPMIELTSYNVDGVDPQNTLLGYAPRYIDYKTRYDLVHGAFLDGGLQNWVAPVSTSYIREYIDSLGTAISSGVFQYPWFKVPPSVVNPLFAVEADQTIATDQLLINCSFDIKAVRNLDRNGLPY